MKIIVIFLVRRGWVTFLCTSRNICSRFRQSLHKAFAHHLVLWITLFNNLIMPCFKLVWTNLGLYVRLRKCLAIDPAVTKTILYFLMSTLCCRLIFCSSVTSLLFCHVPQESFSLGDFSRDFFLFWHWCYCSICKLQSSFWSRNFLFSATARTFSAWI